MALMNQKGGVGKTTSTVNLSAALAEAGRRVLVVDLDPQAHATLHLGATPGRETEADGTVYDLLLDPEADPQACLRNVRPGLDLIAAETDLAAAEGELAALPDRHGRLAAALGRLRTQLPPESRHDAVLLDCPPSLGLLTLNGLVAADEVLIPMQAHFLALQGVGKLLETIQIVRDRLNPRLAVAGVALCMFDGQTTHSREVVADLESFFEEHRGGDAPWSRARVFSPAVRRNIKLAECPSFGQTIFDYAPWAPGALDYRKLGESVLAAWAERDESPQPEIHVPREASPHSAERSA